MLGRSLARHQTIQQGGRFVTLPPTVSCNTAQGDLAELARAYSEFFYHYEAAPLLIVNSEHLNFAERDSDSDLLLQRILDMRGAREFFNLGA